jgi:hypothetical protein
MKKIVFAIVLMFACASVSAQTIIPRVGVSVSNLTIDGEEGFENKSTAGMVIGLGFNFPVSDIFSIQPEINYVQRGTKMEFEMSEFSDFGYMQIDGSIRVRIDYLEIPVLAKVAFGEDTKFLLSAGPTLGVGLGGKTKIKANAKYSFDGETIEESVTQTGKVKFGGEPDEIDDDGDDAYFDNRIDFGLQIGAGLLIKNKVLLDVRYVHGVTDLMKDESSKNKVLQISVGMPFPMKKN